MFVPLSSHFSALPQQGPKRDLTTSTIQTKCEPALKSVLEDIGRISFHFPFQNLLILGQNDFIFVIHCVRHHCRRLGPLLCSHLLHSLIACHKCERQIPIKMGSYHSEHFFRFIILNFVISLSLFFALHLDV